jgi:flagellar hook protein FlgE
MFESMYVGLTGLSTFSRNLTVIGANVSNLNTTGYKSTQLSFSDLVYRSFLSERHESGGASLQLGSGVGAGGTRVLFRQGELRQTGNATDLAISGSGFFVLRGDGGLAYTRSGEFEFGTDGFLVSRATGQRVAGWASGQLTDIGIGALRTNPPRATATVRLIDNLSPGDTSHDVSMTVFDAAGLSHALTLRLTNNTGVTPGSWLLEVRDVADALLSSGEIRFGGDGSPAAGFNNHVFTHAPAGAPASVITLNFGDPGSFAGATGFSAGTDSTLRLDNQDGFGAGSLTQASFDADGVLVAAYSNGQAARGVRLALAFFDSLQDLERAEGGRFLNASSQRVTYGNPGEGLFGSVAAESVESANVDLAQQFSELIVTQRGYQASSQVIGAANEMIQQLFEIRSRR